MKTAALGLAAALVALSTLAAAGCPRHAADSIPILPIGGDFTLTDHNGQPFELSSLRGKVVLLFFGYTFCPDACPTTLSKLASVSRKLGDDAKRVKTLYVSVDPGRDTPAVMKDDLSNFDVDALGLTGTKADIDKVVAKFGAEYEIISTPDSAAKYTIAHSTTLYGIDTEGRTRFTFSYGASVDELVQGIRALLASGPR